MTDRVPGAPGQYQARITAGALAKMQSGEPFPITLTRDDQPLVPGTPYSKAAVLPDALAQKLCPGNPDPTPADALAALLPATHGADRNNPHGVTPAQIGALDLTAIRRAFAQVDAKGSVDSTAVTAYPTEPGVYKVTTALAALPSGSARYGTLVIFNGGGYVVHLYVDNSRRFYVARTTGGTSYSVQAPASDGWYRFYTDGYKPTPADLGAAPAGFGLGGSAQEIAKEELDNTKKTGWYRIWFRSPVTLGGITFTYASMQVIAYDTNAVHQYMYPLFTNGEILCRICEGGVWGQWENMTATIGAALLWQNASPTSGFAAQTVSLDLSGYDHVAINFAFDQNFGWISGWYIFSKNAPKGLRASEVYDQYGVSRKITGITDGGVAFGKSVLTNLSDGSNSEQVVQMIPYQIYGIKGVL